MDIGTFRGVMTLILMVLFIGLVFWAFSRRRHEEFEEAAQLPLEDGARPPRASRQDSDVEGRT